MADLTVERLREIAAAPRDQDGFPDLVLTEREYFAIQELDTLEAERLVQRGANPLDSMSDFLSGCVDDSGTSSEINTVLVPVWMAAREAYDLLARIAVAATVDDPKGLSAAFFVDEAAGTYSRLSDSIREARARADEAVYEEVADA